MVESSRIAEGMAKLGHYGTIKLKCRKFVENWTSKLIICSRMGQCAVSGLNAILCFHWFTNCVLLFDKKSITRMLVTFGICLRQYFDTRYLVFYNTSPPRMFLSLDLL